jgi:lauroyl/myristoyl acyltransferase
MSSMLPTKSLNDSPQGPGAATRRTGLLRTIRKWLVSAGVWALYVPHLALLRLLGPKFGLVWARSVARIHWVLTLGGSQTAAGAAVSGMYDRLGSQWSKATILRKHLEMKHESFALLQLAYTGPPQRRGIHTKWIYEREEQRLYEEAHERGKGVIFVGFHIGQFRATARQIPIFFPGCQVLHVGHRVAHYADDTVTPVAKLALRTAMDTDRCSGDSIYYVHPQTSPLRLAKHLRKGRTVAVAVDGMAADGFIDVPFFGGSLRMASGWARLAALTKASVVVLSDYGIDRQTRRLCVSDHIQCAAGSDECVYQAVAAAARVLEDHIRREPWCWHPWHRLRVLDDNDAKPGWGLAAPSSEAESLGTIATTLQADSSDAAKTAIASSPGRNDVIP